MTTFIAVLITAFVCGIVTAHEYVRGYRKGKDIGYNKGIVEGIEIAEETFEDVLGFKRSK